MALLNYTPRLSHKEPQWRNTCDDLFVQFVDSDPYDFSDNTADSCSSGDLDSIWELPEHYQDDSGVSDQSVPTSSTTSVASKSVADLGQVAASTTRPAFIGDSVVSCKPYLLTQLPKMAQPLLSPRGSQDQWASKLEERAERLSLRDRYQQDPLSSSHSTNSNQWDDQSTFVPMSTTSPCQDVNKRHRRLATYENNPNLRHSQSVPHYPTASFSPLGSPTSDGPYGIDQRSSYNHLHTPATTTDTPFFHDYLFSDTAYTQLAPEPQQQQGQDPEWEQNPQLSAVFDYPPYNAAAPEGSEEPKVQPWWPSQASPAQPCSPAYQTATNRRRAHPLQQHLLSHHQSDDNLIAFAQQQQLQQQPLGGPPQPYPQLEQPPGHLSNGGLMIQFPPSGTAPLQQQQQQQQHQQQAGTFTAPRQHPAASRSQPSLSHPIHRPYSATHPSSLPQAALTSPTQPSAGKSRHASNVEHLRQQRSRSDLRQKSFSSRSPSPDSSAKQGASGSGAGGGSMRRPSGKSGTHRRSKTAGSSNSNSNSGSGSAGAGKSSASGSGAGGSSSAGFVNYTPDDKRKILTGVAPSGSSKTKARREKEAADKRRRLSQAAQKAVMEAGGDLSALEREGFLLDD